MEEKHIFEGKTSTEAIEKGLKELKLRKEDVEINVIKDEKRSFFSILDPRIVKVEITKKENIKENKEVIIKKEKRAMSIESIEKAKENISAFLEVFLKQVSEEKLEYKISNDEFYITVEIIGENTNALIGYRGETLNALQTLLSSIANKNIEEKVRVILDISGYKDKRKKVLEELGVGCQWPIGAIARMNDNEFNIYSILLTKEGEILKEQTEKGSIKNAVELGGRIGKIFEDYV